MKVQKESTWMFILAYIHSSSDDEVCDLAQKVSHMTKLVWRSLSERYIRGKICNIGSISAWRVHHRE